MSLDSYMSKKGRVEKETLATSCSTWGLLKILVFILP